MAQPAAAAAAMDMPELPPEITSDNAKTNFRKMWEKLVSSPHNLTDEALSALKPSVAAGYTWVVAEDVGKARESLTGESKRLSLLQRPVRPSRRKSSGKPQEEYDESEGSDEPQAATDARESKRKIAKTRESLPKTTVEGRVREKIKEIQEQKKEVEGFRIAREKWLKAADEAEQARRQMEDNVETDKQILLSILNGIMATTERTAMIDLAVNSEVIEDGDVPRL